MGPWSSSQPKALKKSGWWIRKPEMETRAELILGQDQDPSIHYVKDVYVYLPHLISESPVFCPRCKTCDKVVVCPRQPTFLLSAKDVTPPSVRKRPHPR